MEHVITACVIFVILAFIWLTFAWVKSDNTCKQREIISNAIYKYHIWCALNNFTPRVSQFDMETYDATDRRWNDWGYTNILPKEKFEIIKRFIEEEKK